MAPPEIFTEMHHNHIGIMLFTLIKIAVVKFPVMRKMGANKYHITWAETFDAVANKLRPTAFFKVNEFNLGMIMPAVIEGTLSLLALNELTRLLETLSSWGFIIFG